MPGTTTRLALPFPLSTDLADGAGAFGTLTTQADLVTAGYQQGLASARPAASAAFQGWIYWATDALTLSYCDGTTWQTLGGGLSIYGDGSDGAVTISSNTSLTRDMFYSSLTVNSGITLTSNGFRIFCQTPIVNNGNIVWNGNAAAGSAPGAALSNANSTLSTVTMGSAGIGAGSGAGGSAPTTSNAFGGSGGTGGTSGANTGGAGGTAAAPATSGGTFRSGPIAVEGRIWTGSSLVVVTGGAGGGAGGGDGTNSGGGGGGGGGFVIIAAPGFTGTGVIQARGGAGGNATTGNASGGGGGGGGVVVIISGAVSGGAISGQTIDANGGAGGTKVGTGNNGTAGSAGTVFLIRN